MCSCLSKFSCYTTDSELSLIPPRQPEKCKCCYWLWCCCSCCNKGSSVVPEYQVAPEYPIALQPQSKTTPAHPAINILISGRSGSGKSALINALLGEAVVPERPGVHDKSRSSEIMSYDTTNSLHPVRVWVSTQLQHLDYVNEEQYKKELKEICEEVNLIIYCIKMTEARFTPGNPDDVAMEELLGPDSLKKTVFALTFANNAASILDDKQLFHENATVQWPEILTSTLNKETIVTPIVVPVGYYKEPSLPTCQNWLQPMWCKCLEVMDGPKRKMVENAKNSKRLQIWKGKQIKPKNPVSLPIVFDSQDELDKYDSFADQAD